MNFPYSHPRMLLYLFDSNTLFAPKTKHLLEKILKLCGIRRIDLYAKLTNKYSWLRYL